MTLTINLGVTLEENNTQKSDTYTKTLTMTKKSDETIFIAASAAAQVINFGGGITTPQTIILIPDGDIDINISDGVNTVNLTLTADMPYIVPSGISSITVDNNNAVNDVYIRKIIGE